MPENCVLRVGEFRALALRAEADGHLRQQLQLVLKLSKEKWEEARDHALRAVTVGGGLCVRGRGRSCVPAAARGSSGCGEGGGGLPWRSRGACNGCWKEG